MAMGVGGMWVGWRGARGGLAIVEEPDGDPARRWWTPTEAWLWRIAFGMAGAGWVGFGLTVMRHSHGPYVDVPASAPRIDQVIWIVSLTCLFSGFAILYTWAMLRSSKKKRSRR